MHLTTRIATGATVIALAASPGLDVAAAAASEEQKATAVVVTIDDQQAATTEETESGPAVP
jgi:hypothetical protein